jgi:cathepsin L
MMKTSLVLALGFGAASAKGDQFAEFMEKFERKYASQHEQEYRRNIFHENLAFIEAENAKGHSYTLGVTHFTDLTPTEFEKQYFTGFVPQKKNKTLSAFRAPEGFSEPASVDWVAKGAVTAVKNQGTCGSCWTFSTTGALEGAAFVAGRSLTSLSEQNILDCDTGGEKCNGGSMDQAFEWVEKNGLVSEADDSYKCSDASTSSCTKSTCPSSGTKTLAVGDVTKYTDVESTESALEAAVAQQPVSVAIEADKTVFQYYTGGVLTSKKCGDQLDHGVLIVGYGTDNGQKYWKVKNSWGSSWGEDGYIRLAKGFRSSECGIRTMASFPTVKASTADRFEQFINKYGRSYSTQHEKNYRHKVFDENMALIEAENAKGKTYTLGVTHFADMTHAEFKSQYLTGFIPQNKTVLSTFRAPVGYVEASSVDWTTKGAVTPVKNQGTCGSCWTFSTTGALEGAAYIAGLPLTSLSEQDILDCDTGGMKCNGGSMPQAFEWVKEHGISSEADDSYKCADASAAECKKSKCSTSASKVLAAGDVTGYTSVEATEGALEAAVEQQPVSVAIEADQTVFQHYTSGVLTSDACGSELDHGVLVVGYGTDNGQKYWKVKNSWGSTFGEEGYIRIEKGSSSSGGECGIRKMASYPTVKASKEIIV